MVAKELQYITGVLSSLLITWLSYAGPVSAFDSPSYPNAQYPSELKVARVIFPDEVGSIPPPLKATDQRIRLATGQGYYPFVSASLPQGGWSQALVTRTFIEMGHKVDIYILPWSRGQMWTEEQRFLGTFPYVYSPERAGKYFFSTPINYIPVRFFVSKASNITDIKQLKNKRLCLPYGYTDDFVAGGVIEQLDLKINRVLDGAGCIGHVQRGWSDAGLTNSYVSLNELTNTRLTDSKLRVLPGDIERVSLHFIISKSYPDGRAWMDKFNQAFERITLDGSKESIDHTFIRLIESQ